MTPRTTIIAALGLLLVIATICILPLSAHPSYRPVEEDGHYGVSRQSAPGMRRLTWWRWGRRNENKREKVSTEPPTTTVAAPMMEFITTTKKPSRWRAWFSKAKEKISKAAKTAANKVKKDFAEVKDKYERGMLIVGDASKDGFYKAGKAIVLGAKKVGNATIKAGRTIKKGAKRLGSAVKRGYQKIRLRFAGPDEKFKILANRIKDKVESGDERAVELLKKIGIHVNVSDQKVIGSQVVNKNISVTEILRNEGMLSNKSSSYFTALEEPEKTEEGGDEFHSAEEDFASETNITDTKVEYERAKTESVTSPDSRTTLHLEDTTTETSISTFSGGVPLLTESSTQATLGDNVDSTGSVLSTEDERVSRILPTVTKSTPLTDSVSTEYSTSSTNAITTSDLHFHSTTMNSPTETFHTTAISPYDDDTTSSSLVDQPTEEISLSENTTASDNVMSNTDTSIQTTPSTISPTTFIDIDKPITANTMRPLHSDLSPKDDYETTSSSSSPAPLIERITSTTQVVSSSPPSFTSPDFVTIPEEASSVSSTVTSPATTRHSSSTGMSTDVTSTPSVVYATTFGLEITNTSTTSPSTTTTYTSPTTPVTTTSFLAAISTTTLPSATSPTTSTTLSPTTSTTITIPPTTSTTSTTPPTSNTPTTSTTSTTPPTTSTTITTPPTTSTTVPPTTPPPPPITTTSSTYLPTTTEKTHPPMLTETNRVLPATPPSASIHGDEETAVEEAYVPPPFPDVFSDVEVHDRLREFYDNGDFSHAEMAEVFNFDPDNYEYYKYDYNYEDYA
ncbi:mucin-2-like [Macrobrachium nipponense]|uniref:mucin-2-like n=1 Tax=Macrobrachium nipponense TaxID=159736 RepID=UPI0030C8195D